MGNCKYCGFSAGMLKTKHQHCEDAHEHGKRKIFGLTVQAIRSTGDYHWLSKNVDKVAATAFLRDDEVQRVLYDAWSREALSLLNTSGLNEVLEERLLSFPEYFSLPITKTDSNQIIQRIHAARQNRQRQRERAELERESAKREREKRARRDRLDKGRKKIIALITYYDCGSAPNKKLIREINQAAKKYDLSRKQLGDAIVAGWEEAIRKMLKMTVLNRNDFWNLVNLAESLSIPKSIVFNSSVLETLEKRQILDDLNAGRLPEELKLSPGSLPFILNKSERLIWLFHQVRQMEWTMIEAGWIDEWGRVFEPRYSWIHNDTGILGVTQSHLYFAGGGLRLRTPYSDVVSIDLLADGIQLTLDGASRGTVQYLTQDSSFFYNLVTKLAQM